jgi:pyridoxamine 5'-phosphate oxidase family protein
MTVTLTEAERTYLKSQPLARLATVDASGAPQNNPVGVFLDEETGDILIGGHAMGASRKFRNVRANGQVALVVDDLVSPGEPVARGLPARSWPAETLWPAGGVGLVRCAWRRGPRGGGVRAWLALKM